MKMNKKETNILCNEAESMKPRVGSMIDDEIIEEFDDYEYLGWLMTPGNEMSAEINKMITKGCIDLVNKKFDIPAPLAT